MICPKLVEGSFDMKCLIGLLSLCAMPGVLEID